MGRNIGNKKSRRFFLNTILKGSLTAFMASVVYPVIRFLIPPKNKAEASPGSVIAGTLNTLKTDSGKIIKFGRQPVILIRVAPNDIRAFSAVCTHLECIVQYRSDFKHIWCACHNGHYDLNGVNISGPPPRPLKPYKVDVKDGKIYVSKETK